MSWRKWLVRSLGLVVLGALGVSGFLYLRWTNPEAVRRQVLEQLSSHLTGADMSLESAHIRLLGGISFRELRLSRGDDAAQNELAVVPAGIIYPDKEQAFNGRFAIRKIELHHPCIHLHRGPDGAWNWRDVFAPPNLTELVPTMVIQQGTILLEDDRAATDQPPLEITDVNLTLVNDPLTAVNFQGNGRSDLAGVVQIQGTFQRASGAAAFSIQARDIALGPRLAQRLGAYHPDVRENAGDLQGTASLQAEVEYTPGAANPWSHNLHFQLEGGKLRHPQIPLELERIRASLACIDGRVEVKEFSARSGAAEVTLTATLHKLQRDANLEANLCVKHLPMSPKVFDQLPANLQRINKEYSPKGAVTLTFRCTRRGGEWVKHCIINPEDLTASYFRFPYPLEHITGIIDQEIDTAKHEEQLRIDLVGLAAGSKPVFIKGSVTGEAATAGVGLKIWGDDVPLEPKLMAALVHFPQYQQLAAEFHPAGLANFEAHFQRPQGSYEFANRFVIHFHHATVNYQAFPYPLEKVSGILDIQPDHWEFYNFCGSHQRGAIFAAGRFQPAPKGGPGRLVIQIRGKDVCLDPELKTALGPQIKQAVRCWDLFHPTGRMNFSALVQRQGNAEPDIEVAVAALGCSVKPDFLPYQLDGLTGTMHYARRWVQVDNLDARHGQSHVHIDKALAYVKPDGGVWAEITNLQGSPLVPDAELVQALPPVVRDTCAALGLQDPFTLKRTKITLSCPVAADQKADVYWEGEMELRHASLKAGVPVEQVTGTAACQGRYNGRELEGLVGNLQIERATLFNQPLRDIQGTLQIRKETPNVLTIPGLYARFFGGELYGPVRVEFGPRPRYEINLTASQVRLEEFGKHNLGPDAPVSGLANARLHLKGDGPEISDLTGQGSVDVENGRMYNLPLLLDLLKFLALRPPDGTAFEEAHARFAIRGQRVAINRFDLFGNSISLRGQGEMNLDGTDINLDFFAVWAARLISMLPPVVKELPQDLSKYLLKIKMRGRINDVHFTQEPVPIVVEPLKGLLERIVKTRRLVPWPGREEGAAKAARPLSPEPARADDNGSAHGLIFNK
jgi:hypothetical protein